jgi:hypothetical protein
MSGFAGKKIPPISDADKQVALSEEAWISGIAFESTGKYLFLKCALYKGGIQTVRLDPARTADLFWYLRRLLRNLPKSAGSPVTLPVDKSVDSVGYWFPSEDDDQSLEQP